MSNFKLTKDEEFDFKHNKIIVFLCKIRIILAITIQNNFKYKFYKRIYEHSRINAIK